MKNLLLTKLKTYIKKRILESLIDHYVRKSPTLTKDSTVWDFYNFTKANLTNHH